MRAQFRAWFEDTFMVKAGCLPIWILSYLFYEIFTGVFVFTSTMEDFLSGFKFGIFVALYVFAAMNFFMYEPKSHSPCMDTDSKNCQDLSSK